MIRIVSIALLVLATPLAARAQDGTFKLYYAVGTAESGVAIIKLESDGAKLVADSPRFVGLTLQSATRTKDALVVTLKGKANELVFQTPLAAPVGKRVGGTLAIDGTLYPAWLEATTDTEFDKAAAFRKIDCAPFEQAKKLEAKVTQLRIQVLTSKDAEKRTALIKQYTEADQQAKKETPGLYREVLEKHADSPAVFASALSLLAASANAKPEEIRAWAGTVATAAKRHGPRYEAEIAVQLADALLKAEGQAKLALEFARQAEKGLTAKSPATEQVRALGVLNRALRKNGELEAAKAIEVRAEPFEVVLDKAYSTKMPGFKETKFDGRKAKSERAVFMELFTGATCPPCVAADLAFDVLQKTYTPRELVLIQYHMHIPGPDPMTNPDTEGRWAYYRKAFPNNVKGVPSSIFNGKPLASGGGGIANAEAKYTAYRGVIDPLLEEAAAAKLSAHAVRKGDRVDIDVSVDCGAPGPEKRLRILVAEETVRYLGSNGIRLHHNVVRACPTGVDGTPLPDASSKHKASVEIGDLRGQLTKYLDNFEKGGRSFLNPSRPMTMGNLRVIAFVQDDNTHEIMQSVQVEVERK